MAQTDWLDEIFESNWKPDNTDSGRYDLPHIKTAIRKHLAEERIDELQNIPGRRAHEGKYIVDIADITDRIAALQQRQSEGE